MDDTRVVMSPAPSAAAGLEVDVEFEVEKRTSKLKRELQETTRKFEREAAEYRLSHSLAIRKISDLGTQHAQDVQQQQQRVLELQGSLAKAQKQQETFEKEARTLRQSLSETETSLSKDMQSLKKALAEAQGTDLAVKCSGLEAKLQQVEAARKSEVLQLQQQLSKLIDSSSTQPSDLPDTAGVQRLVLVVVMMMMMMMLTVWSGMTLSELQRECAAGRKEKQILLQVCAPVCVCVCGDV